MKSLDLKLTCYEISEENITRVVQLINKTNQFNLTTRRYDKKEVEKFVDDKNTYSYCYKVIDRFGDSGIVGVLIAVPEGGLYMIDNWLLSCRVMGRTVENGIFEHLLLWLKKRNIKTLIGEYLPTPKNKPVEKLLEKLKFKENENHKFKYDLAFSFKDNKYVRIES